MSYIYADRTASITNCSFDGKIISACTESEQLGGFIGYHRGNNLTLKNSLSVGEISIPDGCNVMTGAFIGVLRQHGSANSKINNNYYKPASAGSATINPFGNSDAGDDITDGYNGQTVEGSATMATEEQLASGEIAYKLNGSTSEGELAWGQNIDGEGDKDAYPVLGGAKVYNPHDNVYSNYQNVVANGKCGENLYWRLLGNGTLTIFGTGDMWDYDNSNNKAPWRNLNPVPTTLVLEEEMTSIGNYAFYECSGFTGSLTIGSSVNYIGEQAFHWCSKFSDVFFYREECPEIGSNAFSNLNYNAKVYVPVIWNSVDSRSLKQLR